MLRGIYVHIPFCVAKCRYCDFNSYPERGSSEKEAYLQTLLSESAIYARMFRESPAFRDVSVESIYLGGGTPTCLTGGQLCFLLQALRGSFSVRPQAKITIEGNPGTLDLKKLRELWSAGFNRLSLGAQSFIQHELTTLGRIHTAAETRQAFSWAREAGFTNIGLVLLSGLPGQDLSHWQDNPKCALDLEPEHISLYQLKIEEGTPFHKLLLQGELQEFPDEEAAVMYEEASRILAQAGYRHYEISNFAKPGRESRHNQLYWRNEEYLGLGAGASGYLKGVRYRNEPVLADYQLKLQQGLRPLESEEEISPDLQLAEAVFLGLRLVEGIVKEEFFCRYGVQIGEKYGEAIARLKVQGLLMEDKRRLALTQQGLKLANLVFMEFLP